MRLKIISFALAASLLICMYSCSDPEKKQADELANRFPEVQKLSDFPQTVFVPVLEDSLDMQRNNIYCVALLYAWDEIRQQLGGLLAISDEWKDLNLMQQIMPPIHTSQCGLQIGS